VGEGEKAGKGGGLVKGGEGEGGVGRKRKEKGESRLKGTEGSW